MNKYHTAVKISYALGTQKQWIPKNIRDIIPASTAHGWKHYLKKEDFIGNDLVDTIQGNIIAIENMYHPVNAFPLKIFTAFSRLTVLITRMIEPQILHKTLRENKVHLINAIERLAPEISFKTACMLLGFKDKTLYHWRTLVKFKCDASALFLCMKRHPNQATIREVSVIKEHLTNPEHKHWGVHSCWAYAFKKNITSLSANTWRHYNNLLGIRKGLKKANKPTYTPLRATTVNQIWHADITVFKTLDGIKYYIYTIMDNYSRFSPVFRIAKVVSAKIRIETIKEAIALCWDKIPDKLMLVTDGGTENDNLTVKEFVTNCEVNIHHNIALRDIVQSNSMVEALHSTAKYRYLYMQPIHNYKELFDRFTEMMHDYNYVKPHHALKIFNPSEVYKGADLNLSYKDRYVKAAVERRAFNKKHACGGC